mgnify:CR=1 FL=1
MVHTRNTYLENNIKEPGKTGSQWRILYSMRLPDLRCDYFDLTATTRASVYIYNGRDDIDCNDTHRHDTDRDDTRMFRLSRVQGAVRPEKRSGTYDVPAGTDIRSRARA